MSARKLFIESKIDALLDELKKNLKLEVINRAGRIPLGANYLPDGFVLLRLSKEEIPLVLEVKGHLANLYQIKKILNFAKEFTGICCLVAEAIDRKVKEQLRVLGIAYYEINNELFFPVLYRNFENKKRVKGPLLTTSKGFHADSSFKLLFYFIVKPESLNFTQRQLSEALGISLGTINSSLKSLEKIGLIQLEDRRKRKLGHFDEIVESWRNTYLDFEKNKLSLGRFSPINEDFYADWKKMSLQSIKGYWGGEAGASLVTNYLRPGLFTIYCYENSLGEVLKNLRLKKDPLGKIEIINAFWPEELNNSRDQITPLFLIYCELLNSGIDRNKETATYIKKIMMEKNEY